MSTLLYVGLANAACAALLAVPALLATRFCRRPALVHSLWLLVLIKLVTPPIFRPPVAWLPEPPPPAARAEATPPAPLTFTDGALSAGPAFEGTSSATFSPPPFVMLAPPSPTGS